MAFVPPILTQHLCALFPNLGKKLPGNSAGDGCHLMGRVHFHPNTSYCVFVLRLTKRTPRKVERYTKPYASTGKGRWSPRLEYHVSETVYRVYRMDARTGKLTDYLATASLPEARRMLADITKPWDDPRNWGADNKAAVQVYTRDDETEQRVSGEYSPQEITHTFNHDDRAAAERAEYVRKWIDSLTRDD